MSTGGYKCVKFSWQGGRSDTPVDRVKFILNGVCDAIIGANVGWQLDTLTPTSSDFLTMPSTSSGNPNLVKVLKLEYDSHVYRMGIGYNYDMLSTSYKLKPEDVCPVKMSNNYCEYSGCFYGCLYFCMIKDGTLTTDSTYSYIWDGQGQFLKWMPFAMNGWGSGNSTWSAALNNSSGKTYTYYVILKNAQVAIAFKASDWGTHLKCIIAGEIFKETGHTTDTNTFGAIGLTDLNQTDYSLAIASSSSTSKCILINAYQGYIKFTDTNTEPTGSQIISSNGTGYANCTGNLTWKCRLGFDITVISNDVSTVTTSPGGRWTPCYMFLQAADHDTYGVVHGDGFKGYIDTDLLRGVNPNYSYGQQLQGGDFVYLGGGFAIGWDADNEILLF